MQCLVLAGPLVGAHQLLAQCPVQDLVDQRAFAGAGNPCDRDKAAQREFYVDVFQVILFGAHHLQESAAAGTAARGQGDTLGAGKVLPGDGFPAGFDARHRAAVYHVPAVDARARADIDDIIGGLHRFLVVLHHNNGIAQVAQVFQRLYQSGVIPLVQSDGGLVQNIQHPHQTGADLGGQPDALAFAAGKGAGGAGQRQVVQPHVGKKEQPAPDLLEDLSGNALLHFGQGKGFHKVQRLLYAHLAEIADIDAADGHRQYFRPQAVAVAVGTGDRRHKGGDIVPHPVAAGFLKPPLQVIYDPLKVVDELALKSSGLPHHFKFLPFGAEQHQVQLVPWHLLHRDIQRHAKVLFQPLKVHFSDGSLVTAPAGRLKGAVPDGTVRIPHHQRRVHLLKNAQPGAGGAAAGGIVEGEHIGRKLLDGNIMVRAGIVLAEQHLLPADDVHQGKPPGHGAAGLYRIRQPGADLRLDRKAVHHNLDGVLIVFLQLDLLGQLVQAAVHPGPDIPAAAGGVQLLLVGAFALPHDGRHHLDAGPRRQGQHLIHHLVHRLLGDLPAADGAVRDPYPGIQQPQVVVDLGHGTDGGTRVLAGGFLVDGNSGGKAGNFVHIGLFRLSQKHSGIGGQTLHVASLPVCVDGIKGQGGLAGAGKPCKDDQLIPRDLQVDILEVVLPRPADHDFI